MTDPYTRDEASPVVVPPGGLPAGVLETATGPVFCPNPAMPIWSTHPRVYLEVDASGTAHCPYCGTAYRLAAGHAGGH